LQKILDSYGAGIQITQFQLQRIEPPAQVVEAFNDLQSSLADADRSSNEAQSYSNDILPKARGQAESVLRNAEAYAEEVVAKAEGETSRFTQVLQANRKNPRITRIRMHREVMEQMLKQANVSIVDHDLSKSLQNYNQLTPAPLLHKREGA
jgi:membrane protease subunit HflK